MTQACWSKTIWLYATARVSGEVPIAAFGRPNIARTALCTLCGDNLTLYTMFYCAWPEIFNAWTRSCFHVPVENKFAPWVKHLPTLVLWNLSRPSVSLGHTGKISGDQAQQILANTTLPTPAPKAKQKPLPKSKGKGAPFADLKEQERGLL